ncbi:MAG: hypothetical protein J5824_03885 [Lachnospiraceae bacterium]|nr:hypothetical protein [Lachnospiraceae bacterium]
MVYEDQQVSRIALLAYILKDTKSGKKYIDRSFEFVPDDMFPHPVYDDLRQISHILVESGDKKRAAKILELMKIYAQNNPGTLEQLIAYRTMTHFPDRFRIGRLF